MKYLGIAFIMIFCAMAGQYLSQRLSQRIKILEQISAMLNLIKTQLEFCNAPIDDMLSYLKEKRELSYLSFIERCGELCCMGEQFPIAWKTSIDESKQLSALKKEDADILYSLGNALGTTDLNGQLSICDFHINAVKDKMVHARENFKTYAKVYSTMGVLIGAALGVILI